MEPSAREPRRSPRLIADVIRTRERRHRIGFASGWFVAAPCSSWRLTSSTARAGLTGWPRSDVPISGVAIRQTHARLAAANVGVVWAGRQVHRGDWPRSDSGAQPAQRSRHRTPSAGRRLFMDCPTRRSKQRGGSDIALISTARLAISASGSAVSHRRAALRVVRQVGTRGRIVGCRLIRAAV